MKRATLMLVAVALLLGGVAGQAKADFINGDFQTGSLTPWIVFTTPNGNNGSGLPDVQSFDTTGTGASLAAHFRVGETSFTRLQEGGGIYQTFSLAAGTYEVKADIAAISSGNFASGVFSVYVDGNLLDSTDLTPASLSGTTRGTLDATFTLTAGSHNIGFEITRPFIDNAGTPNEYIDNASLTTLSSSAVPEPGTLTLMGIGIVGMAGYGWRRRKQPLPS